MLKSETHTSKIEAEIMQYASTSPDIKPFHKNLTTTFKHGQWWVSCLDCGAQWSVVDCSKNGSDYLDFKAISQGDKSCLELDTADENSCIAGMKCPKCGYTESFRIAVSTIMEFDAEGETFDGDGEGREWEDSSFCQCPECNHEGTVGEFKGRIPNPSPKTIKANDILAFVNLIANMTADGDPIGADGELLHDGTDDDCHFEMQPEDAIFTMGELIAKARKLQDPERHNVLLVSDRELNQVLAALRHWQRGLPYNAKDQQYSEYLEDGLTFMDADDIDILCERFNLGPVPDEDDAKFAHMKKVKDGYFCKRHQKHSPGMNPYCRDCDRGE